MAIEVRDHLSNTPEHIEALAQALGKGQRLAVFKAIYHHKKRVKTVIELMEATGLSRVRVLQLAGQLTDRGFVEQTKVDNVTAYRTIKFFQTNKRRVLRYVESPETLEKLPTKRRFRLTVKLPSSLKLPTKGAQVVRITIDDIDTFAKIRSVKPGDNLPKSVSEDDFKNGVQAIIGEKGDFKDWGGENSDLYSSRLILKGARLTAAFAFKGPGLAGKLVPGKMGKNGDQAQRMFTQDADIFFAQHWREIDASVLETMRVYAVAKSISTGRKVYYGVIDGQDSERLRRAYPRQFEQK